LLFPDLQNIGLKIFSKNTLFFVRECLAFEAYAVNLLILNGLWERALRVLFSRRYVDFAADIPYAPSRWSLSAVRVP